MTDRSKQTLIASMPVSAAAATLPRRGFLLAPGVALLWLLTPGLAKAQPRIGSVNYVRVWAYGSKSADKWRDLFTHDAVFAQQGVRTVPKGAAHIRFVDGTDLRIGGSSELVLDEFVYDPGGGAGTFTVDMAKGILRMVTGKLAKQGIQIKTPTVSIGVRGTDFIVAVLASGLTIISVLVGLVVVTPVAGGDAVEVGAGSTATVAVGATTVTITTAPPPTDDGIADDAELQGELGQDANDSN